MGLGKDHRRLYPTNCGPHCGWIDSNVYLQCLIAERITSAVHTNGYAKSDH